MTPSKDHSAQSLEEGESVISEDIQDERTADDLVHDVVGVRETRLVLPLSENSVRLAHFVERRGADQVYAERQGDEHVTDGAGDEPWDGNDLRRWSTSAAMKTSRLGLRARVD